MIDCAIEATSHSPKSTQIITVACRVAQSPYSKSSMNMQPQVRSICHTPRHNAYQSHTTATTLMMDVYILKFPRYSHDHFPSSCAIQWQQFKYANSKPPCLVSSSFLKAPSKIEQRALVGQPQAFTIFTEPPLLYNWSP